MQLLAISPDSQELAVKMADSYGIEFPLLSDPEHKLAKVHTGLTQDGFPRPTLLIVDREGQVVFRQRAENKSDRMYAAQLAAKLDELFGDRGGSAVAGDFANNNLLYLGLGVGLHRDTSNHFATEFDLGYTRNIGEYLGIGAELGALVLSERELRASAHLRLRLPFWAGVGDLYLQAPIGVTRTNGFDGLYFGAILGQRFEISPSFFAMQEFAYERTQYDAGTSTRYLYSVGAGLAF